MGIPPGGVEYSDHVRSRISIETAILTSSRELREPCGFVPGDGRATIQAAGTFATGVLIAFYGSR